MDQGTTVNGYRFVSSQPHRGRRAEESYLGKWECSDLLINPAQRSCFDFSSLSTAPQHLCNVGSSFLRNCRLVWPVPLHYRTRVHLSTVEDTSSSSDCILQSRMDTVDTMVQ